MNSVPIFRFSQLSVSISRTSVRHGHTRSRQRVPQVHKAKLPKGHGEQIWVWTHSVSNQVVYSNTKQLESHRALKQLPFNGKKSKPAKLRRDYWQPLAMIQLPKGAGAAGQSVFQKLREFRRLHELCWDESLFKAPEAPWRARSRYERSLVLNDQRANAIADMAAVLAGGGRGNRLIVSPEEKAQLNAGVPLLGRKWSQAPPVPTAAVAGKKGAAEAPSKLAKSAKEEVEGKKKATGKNELLPATIFWSSDVDRHYAKKWSKNVSHQLFQDAARLLKAYPNQPPPETKKSDGEPKDRQVKFVIKEKEEPKEPKEPALPSFIVV